MKCTNCGTDNAPNNRFCLNCGVALAVTTDVKPFQPPPSTAQPSAPEPQTDWQTLQQPTYQPPHPSGYATHPSQPIGAPSISALNIWGPFAGYGTRRRHTGWLMEGEGKKATTLFMKVEEKIRERQIPGTQVLKETLVARGIIVESRPYLIFRRGLVSLALYISKFGRDLFISQASYLKPPISNFRVIVLTLMLLFQAYMMFYYPTAINNAFEDTLSGFSLFGTTTSSTGGGSLTSLCCLGVLSLPNSLALSLFAVFSAYKWLTEKDIWAGLRVQPNEFNEDDLMALEKAVEETVRHSLTELKLNPENLKMATAGRGGQLF